SATRQRGAMARPRVETASRAADAARSERRGWVRLFDMTSSLRCLECDRRNRTGRGSTGSSWGQRGTAPPGRGPQRGAPRLGAGRRTGRLDDHDAELALVLCAAEADDRSGRRGNRVRGTRFVLLQDAADGVSGWHGRTGAGHRIEDRGLMRVPGGVVPAYEVALKDLDVGSAFCVPRVELEIGALVRRRVLRGNELDRPVWHRGLPALRAMIAEQPRVVQRRFAATIGTAENRNFRRQGAPPPRAQAASSVTAPSSSRPCARYWPILSSSGASDTE